MKVPRAPQFRKFQGDQETLGTPSRTEKLAETVMGHGKATLLGKRNPGEILRSPSLDARGGSKIKRTRLEKQVKAFVTDVRASRRENPGRRAHRSESHLLASIIVPLTATESNQRSSPSAICSIT